MITQQLEIIPGILEKDFSRVEERVKLVEPFIDWIQIDIADGKLVPNTSFLNPIPFKKLIAEIGKKFELHMMVENPFAVAEKWVEVGFKRLLLHWEGIQDKSKFKDQSSRIKVQGIEIGLAIDKDTPVEVVFPYLDDIDCVLIMTIKAGYSGQSFIPEMLEKVRVLRTKKPELPIEVDGGINDETAKLAVTAGATRLVSTSYIFNSENMEEAIEKLKIS